METNNGSIIYLLYLAGYTIYKRAIKQSSSPEEQLLKAVAGRKLSKEEAKDLSNKIKEHKWNLSERLNRDVGTRVAAIDYFENINPL